jgi:hypothetical protein
MTQELHGIVSTGGKIIVGGIEKRGLRGEKGEQGDTGEQGIDGVGISSIEKTSSAGLVDTYTITFDDGDTETFEITNGADGQDGHSPVVTASKAGKVTTVYVDGSSIATINDGNDGTNGTNGQDGHSPVVTASKAGKVTTVSVDGSSIATINDGDDGNTGATGERGGIIHRITANINGYTTPVGNFTPVGRCKISDILAQSGADKVIVGDVLAKGTYLYGVGAVDSTYAYTTAGNNLKGDTGDTGSSGADGYSPSASVSKSGSTATITITDKGGTTTAQVSDGGGVSDVTVDGTSVLDGTVAKVVLTGKADVAHTHAKADITDFPTIPSSAGDVGAIALPSSPSNGDFLVYNGSSWVAQSLSTWQGGSY